MTAIAVASGLFPAEDAAVVDAMMAGYEAGGRAAGHRCLIDEDDRVAVGVAYVQPVIATVGTWNLTMIAVRPAHQGRGRGAALLRQVEDALRADRQRLLLVETSGSDGFARTRAFYRRCGYDEEARIREYYAAGEDMVLFRKALAG